MKVFVGELLAVILLL